jgi:hypothetical protein
MIMYSHTYVGFCVLTADGYESYCLTRSCVVVVLQDYTVLHHGNSSPNQQIYIYIYIAQSEKDVH